MLSRLYILSSVTYQQIARQSIYYIIILASMVLLFIAAPFTLFSFGEELSMMKEIGLATIIFAGIIVAILSSDFVVSSEIEKQTALMILTKPIKRTEFIVGKFLGIIFSIFMATVFLSIIFLLVYWLKEGSDMIKGNLWNGVYLKEGSSQIWKDTLFFLKRDGFLLIKGCYACFLLVSIVAAFALMLSLFCSLLKSR